MNLLRTNDRWSLLPRRRIKEEASVHEGYYPDRGNQKRFSLRGLVPARAPGAKPPVYTEGTPLKRAPAERPSKRPHGLKPGGFSVGGPRGPFQGSITLPLVWLAYSSPWASPPAVDSGREK